MAYSDNLSGPSVSTYFCIDLDEVATLSASICSAGSHRFSSRANKKKFAEDLDKYGSIEEAIGECSEELQDLQDEIADKSKTVEKLTNIVNNLEYEKDAITENLRTHAELAQVVLAATRIEGGQSIIELTAKAQEDIETCRQLLQEAKDVSQSSVLTVGKMNTEVMKQFEALSRLEGYKDLAEIVGKISSSEDAKRVLQHPQQGIDLLVHTSRVLRLLVSIYEQLGPDGASIVRPLEGVRSGVLTYVAGYAATVANASKNAAENTGKSQQTGQDKNQQKTSGTAAD